MALQTRTCAYLLVRRAGRAYPQPQGWTASEADEESVIRIVNNVSTDNARLRGGDFAGIQWFDLKDISRDPNTGEFNCYGNTWNNNRWGSAGYTPECTSTRGLGKGKNPAANADPNAAADREPRGRQAPDFANNGS